MNGVAHHAQVAVRLTNRSGPLHALHRCPKPGAPSHPPNCVFCVLQNTQFTQPCPFPHDNLSQCRRPRCAATLPMRPLVYHFTAPAPARDPARGCPPARQPSKNSFLILSFIISKPRAGRRADGSRSIAARYRRTPREHWAAIFWVGLYPEWLGGR